MTREAGTAGNAETPAGRVAALFVYPVKGLSPQRVKTLPVEPGAGVEGDRVFALARPEGRYVKGQRQPLPKDQFFMLARDARLAGLGTHFDAPTNRLTVAVREHEVLSADVSTEEGERAVTAFFGRVLDCDPERPPVLARERDRRFTDVSVVSDGMMNAVSIINMASVRDLERRTGAYVDPLRFRANIYVDGLPAWCERELAGEDLAIGGLRLRGVLATKRCAATEVNPETAERDLPLPRLLHAEYGHIEMGWYAEATGGHGPVFPGDRVVFGAEGDRS
ncbi:MOSC N-terminal beta barrel domain-containing protein [Saccharomonospora sp. NPDC006951]